MNLTDYLRQMGAGQRASRVRPNDMIAFDGGMNLVDPPVSMKPGQLLGVKNYEPGVRGGYTRVEGYERFDGRASPTRANYWVLEFQSATQPFLIGDEIAQFAGPGATNMIASGRIAYARQGAGGSWIVGLVEQAGGGGTFASFIPSGYVYTNHGAGWVLAGANVYAFRNGASDDAINEDVIYAKTEYMRTRVMKVGDGMCAGPVRGVAIVQGRVVAWRDNIARTQCLMFTTNEDPWAGWQLVPLGSTLAFTGGVLEIEPGMTLTGATSGRTYTVGRVSVDTGAWGPTEPATGELSLTFSGGAPTAGENLRIGATVYAIAGALTANTLPPGGKYRTRVRNFDGYGDRVCLYGVNGVGRAFEWDPVAGSFTFLLTGMPTPASQIFVINDHLGLCYPGGSIQHSGYQRPLSWSPVTGADERSVGGQITEVLEETNNVVFISTRQQVHVLSGRVLEDFRLDLYTPETGMLPDTAARLGQSIYLDDRGFTTLRASEKFGNFVTNSISDKILPLVQTQLQGQNVVGAIVSRRKNLYRCFFSDGVALVISTRPGNNLSGWTVTSYLHQPTCLVSGEVESTVGFIPGQIPGMGPLFPERTFMGSADGYVYELDIGNSFDGQPIEAFCRFTYHNTRSPDVFKHYRKAVIDVDVAGVVTLYATVDFNYGNRSGQAGEQVEFLGGGGLWDIANWDQFKWSGQAFDQVVLKIEGDGYNIGLFFYTSSNREASHTIYNVTYHYSMRRLNRGSQGG